MQKAAPGDRCGLQENGGAAYWNRTSDPQLRRLLLYPTELTPHAYLDLLSSSYKYSGSDAVPVSIRNIHFRRLHNSRLLCPLFGGADLCPGSYMAALCGLQRSVARLLWCGLPAPVARHVVRRLGAQIAEPKGWHACGKLLVSCFLFPVSCFLFPASCFLFPGLRAEAAAAVDVRASSKRRRRVIWVAAAPRLLVNRQGLWRLQLCLVRCEPCPQVGQRL